MTSSVLKYSTSSTVEPRNNEGPRDWQNLFAIPKFRYIKVLSTCLTITGVKKIVCYTEDFDVEVHYIKVPLY